MHPAWQRLFFGSPEFDAPKTTKTTTTTTTLTAPTTGHSTDEVAGVCLGPQQQRACDDLVKILLRGDTNFVANVYGPSASGKRTVVEVAIRTCGMVSQWIDLHDADQVDRVRDGVTYQRVPTRVVVVRLGSEKDWMQAQQDVWLRKLCADVRAPHRVVCVGSRRLTPRRVNRPVDSVAVDVPDVALLRLVLRHHGLSVPKGPLGELLGRCQHDLRACQASMRMGGTPSIKDDLFLSVHRKVQDVVTKRRWTEEFVVHRVIHTYYLKNMNDDDSSTSTLLAAADWFAWCDRMPEMYGCLGALGATQGDVVRTWPGAHIVPNDGGLNRRAAVCRAMEGARRCNPSAWRHGNDPDFYGLWNRKLREVIRTKQRGDNADLAVGWTYGLRLGNVPRSAVIVSALRKKLEKIYAPSSL